MCTDVECKGDWQFHCADRKRCIDRRRICDGYNDCYDRSDERDCKNGEMDIHVSNFSKNSNNNNNALSSLFHHSGLRLLAVQVLVGRDMHRQQV